ncbi:MAG: hypothetical protein B7O98_04815 [Zestosphaera tikiterensis]|uniref:A-type ATP synthase subunit D n=1 Tax=Zestosphaera tikiterensis TaxID=1973259 RepID=A0A2R7Y5I5_9CREN|nr:MAG: hypothetical protein B7O98_04815 [Zestosphaera tikiterensis]
MSQQVLRLVRPTKIEFIRLRRRLAIARRLYKVLKDRLLILTQEFIAEVKEAYELRKKIHELIVTCDTERNKALTYTTPQQLNDFIAVRVEGLNVVVGTRVVAGVRIPLLELEVKEGVYKTTAYPITLEAVGKCYDEVLKYSLRLAELEASIALIGKEVQRVKRRVNALENIVIPRLIATIKYLRMKFEEREREDKIRRKRIKQILMRKSEAR